MIGIANGAKTKVSLVRKTGVVYVGICMEHRLLIKYSAELS